MRGASSLITRSIVTRDGRTSLRIEPDLWEALKGIAYSEGYKTVSDLVQRIEGDSQRIGSRVSLIRVFLLNYYRERASVAA